MMIRPALQAAFLVVAFFASGSAEAHFKLKTPASWAQQDPSGNPQKAAPCGDDVNGVRAIPTNILTTVQEGSLLTITLDETIQHPGHYRVAIAQDHSSLPADPPVIAGSTPCGSSPITANPTLPVLADGQLVHTGTLVGTQTIQVQLPAGFTCTNCTLQVIEFMSDHALNNPGGCFYHQCANLTVAADAGSTPTTSMMDGGMGTGTGTGMGTGTGTGMGNGTGSGADAGTNNTQVGDATGCASAPVELLPIAAAGLIAALLLRRRSKKA